MGAAAADYPQHLPHIVDHAVVEHRLAELDVTEMAWAVNLGAHASLAEAVLVHRAQEVIVNAVRHRVAILPVELLFVDVLDGHARHVLL